MSVKLLGITGVFPYILLDITNMDTHTQQCSYMSHAHCIYDSWLTNAFLSNIWLLIPGRLPITPLMLTVPVSA